MKSIDEGDGPSMTPLEIAQDIILNRNDNRCTLNNKYSQILARALCDALTMVSKERRRKKHLRRRNDELQRKMARLALGVQR